MTGQESSAASRRVPCRSTNVWRWYFALGLALALAGCEINEEAVSTNPDVSGTPSDPPAPPPPPPAPPPPPTPPPPPVTQQAAFEATLYPLLIDTANFCVNCHAAGQDPTFAAADPTVAYNAIVSQQKVNLSNPELSRVYLRPKDERHNCGGDVSCDRIAADAWSAHC